MTTYSTSLKLALIGDGEQSGLWGQTTNTNLGTLLEQAITGSVSINMADSNVTLTSLNGASDQARNQVLILTGANNGIRDVIPPLVKKTYIVINNTTGGYAIRVIGSSGTGVNIPNGTACLVYCDATNFYSALSGSAGSFYVNGGLTVTSTSNLGGALTYGGVTLSNAVTGTGNMVLSASPTFTGTPSAPTASPGTNTTQIATTAFVNAQTFPSGGIIMWSGTILNIPSGWLLCDGTNGTPDLRDRFVVGAGSTYAVAATGGSANATLVSHTHTASVTDPGHNHTYDYNTGGTTPNQFATTQSNPYQVKNTSTAFTGITVGISTEGSSATNANLPPYFALAYIMKA